MRFGPNICKNSVHGADGVPRSPRVPSNRRSFGRRDPTDEKMVERNRSSRCKQNIGFFLYHIGRIRRYFRYPKWALNPKGCGKTTLSLALAKALKAELKRTPPPELSPLRSFFDDKSKCQEEVRRSFYQLGNYMLAHSLVKTHLHIPLNFSSKALLLRLLS